MSKFVQTSMRKAPTVLGGGILGVVAVGLTLGVVGLSLGMIGEAISAIAGMAVASRFA